MARRAAPLPAFLSSWLRSSSACSRNCRFLTYSSTKTETFARRTHGSNGLEM